MFQAIAKFVRKTCRKVGQRRRVYKRGWQEFGIAFSMAMSNRHCQDERMLAIIERKLAWRVKRANWIYNLLNHGVAFHGKRI